MDLLITAITALGAVLLPVAALLLQEELTFGGLVRLLLAPRPQTSERDEPKRVNGGGKCLR
jgi:hypothetical protein